jgi:hypothetical protein
MEGKGRLRSRPTGERLPAIAAIERTVDTGGSDAQVAPNTHAIDKAGAVLLLQVEVQKGRGDGQLGPKIIHFPTRAVCALQQLGYGKGKRVRQSAGMVTLGSLMEVRED